MKRKKRRSALRQTVKDIAIFGVGSAAVGAGAKTAGVFGSTYAKGVGGAAKMMPAMGSLVVMKGMIRMLGAAQKKLKYKRRRR